MKSKELVKIAIDALEDINAHDIAVLEIDEMMALFDCIIVASADSNRQTRALANNVQEKVKAAGGTVLSIEGQETGEWLLVDLGDVVVHIMLPAVREYYDLESLWAETKLLKKHTAD